MATTQTFADPASQPAPSVAARSLLISLPSLPPEALDHVLKGLHDALAGAPAIVATPDAASDSTPAEGEPFRVVGYTPVAPLQGTWALTAAEYLNAYELAGQYSAESILLLGPEAQTLEPAGLQQLIQAARAGSHDLAVPHYTLTARAGLVNSSLLYPLTRALFAAPPRFPLPLDLAVSRRMLERLAAAAQRFTASGQSDALLWPVAEAAVAGFSITEVDAGGRSLPQPASLDLNTALAVVAGSLFADVEQKAAWWQRARTTQPSTVPAAPFAFTPHGSSEVAGMIDQFRLAYSNLREIWSLVLPPQTLLGLKRLSTADVSTFRMGDSLWARTVYDFVLAYRLRTINRSHLLGALTPLYLAWVASHVLTTESGTDPERHIQSVAAAFETDKPYLVSRWRWPDRFNP